MKIFLSWSGPLSHAIALAFRDWLPQMLNKVAPYVSSEDIDKGERWASDIAKELEASSFGIIFITPGNLNAPWINFEAGALSKTVDRSHVVPFLFGMKRSEVVGPLLQFQSAVDDQHDVEKLIRTINGRLKDEDRRSESQLQTAFEVWYPHLRKKLDELASAEKDEAVPEVAEQRRPTALLEEVLEIVRNQQKLLRSPELLFPEKYIRYLFRKSGAISRVEEGDKEVMMQREAMHDAIIELEKHLKPGDEAIDLETVQRTVKKLHDQFHRRFGRPFRREFLPKRDQIMDTNTD